MSPKDWKFYRNENDQRPYDKRNVLEMFPFLQHIIDEIDAKIEAATSDANLTFTNGLTESPAGIVSLGGSLGIVDNEIIVNDSWTTGGRLVLRDNGPTGKITIGIDGNNDLGASPVGGDYVGAAILFEEVSEPTSGYIATSDSPSFEIWSEAGSDFLAGTKSGATFLIGNGINIGTVTGTSTTDIDLLATGDFNVDVPQTYFDRDSGANANRILIQPNTTNDLTFETWAAAANHSNYATYTRRGGTFSSSAQAPANSFVMLHKYQAEDEASGLTRLGWEGFYNVDSTDATPDGYWFWSLGPSAGQAADAMKLNSFSGVFELGQYGSGSNTASALSKTGTDFVLHFANDGTVLERSPFARQYTPSSSADGTGTVGDITYDASFHLYKGGCWLETSGYRCILITK